MKKMVMNFFKILSNTLILSVISFKRINIVNSFRKLAIKKGKLLGKRKIAFEKF